MPDTLRQRDLEIIESGLDVLHLPVRWHGIGRVQAHAGGDEGNRDGANLSPIAIRRGKYPATLPPW